MPRKNWYFPENQQDILALFFDIPCEDQTSYVDNLNDDHNDDDVHLTRLEERCFIYEEEFFYSLQRFIASGFKRKRNKKIRIRPKHYHNVHKMKKAEKKEAQKAEMVSKKYSVTSPTSVYSSMSYSTPISNASACNSSKPLPNSVHERELQSVIGRPGQHDSGLTFAQLTDLCNRELTPEDYELLLSLDNTVSKKTVQTGKVESFKEKVITEATEELCSVCMCTYEKGEKTKVLPCTHFFHVDCIVPWLTNHSQTCPMCKVNVTV